MNQLLERSPQQIHTPEPAVRRSRRFGALIVAGAVIAGAALAALSTSDAKPEPALVSANRAPAEQPAAEQVLLTEASARAYVADFMATRAITEMGEYRVQGEAPTGAEEFLSAEAKAAYDRNIEQGVFRLGLYPAGPGEGWTYEIVSVGGETGGWMDVVVNVQKSWEDGDQAAHTERLTVGSGTSHTGEPAGMLILEAELIPA
jgi:hypothetical protein